MKSKAEKILFIPIILLLGVMPLIVRLNVGRLSGRAAEVFKKEDYLDFYSQGKSWFIIGVTIIMLIAVLLHYSKAYLKKDRTVGFVAAGTGLYIISAGVSAILSPYKQIALWGIFDRAEGFIILACYVVIMFYAIYVFNDEQDYKYIIIPLSALVILSAVIGVSQSMGRDILLTDVMKKIIIPDEYASVRENLVSEFNGQLMTSTMYNPNYVGSFCSMMVPLFILTTLHTKGIKKKLFFAFVSLCALILLIGSGSSAGVLACIITSVVCIVIYFSQILGMLKTKKKPVYLSIGALIILVLVTSPLWFANAKELIKQAGEMAAPSSTDDYRNKLPIKDIVTKDGKTILFTQNDSIKIAYENYKFNFYDSQDRKIDYQIKNKYFVTEDPRFSEFQFRIFNADGHDDIMAGLALIDPNSDYMQDKQPGTFLFLKGLPDSGVFIMNMYTQNREDNDTPETIGFRGKEALGSGRGYIWSRTLPILKHTLIKGYGADTFALVFPQREYLGKYYAFYNAQITVDKPHNLYLQIAVNNGLIALVGFLILITAYIADSIKLYTLKAYYSKYQKIGITMFLAVISYLIAGFFNDSAISVASIFWILLGTGIAVNSLAKKERQMP